jgi:hypothetical protein
MAGKRAGADGRFVACRAAIFKRIPSVATAKRLFRQRPLGLIQSSGKEKDSRAEINTSRDTRAVLAAIVDRDVSHGC